MVMTSPYQNEFHYTPDILKTYTIALADRFNNIKVRRFADDWISVVKTLDVGLNTMVPTKMQLERTEDYTSDGGQQRFYQTEPFMNLSLSGLNIDKSRNANIQAVRELYTDRYGQAFVDDIFSDLAPTPYNFSWRLQIRTNSYEDSSQILEQILPFFNDDNFLRIRELPFLNIERNIQVVLDGVSPEIPDSLGEEEMRSVNWTIDFTLKGFMYKPTSNIKIIEKIRTIVELEQNGVITRDFDFDVRGIRLSTQWYYVDSLEDLPSDAFLGQVDTSVVPVRIKYKIPITPIPIEAVDIKADSNKNIVTFKIYRSV
jgi:hypothetical protein